MAERSLAVSFAPLGRGLDVDCVDGDHLSGSRQAIPVGGVPGRVVSRATSFVNCGRPLRGLDVEVRDEQGRSLPERHCGTIFVRGKSVMSGYFEDPETTREVLSPDGWLNTGDVGYMVRGGIVITGRVKDMIIINGRNIWPQDLEYLAERQPGVRTGDASAFSIPGPGGEEIAVMLVQCRESEPAKRQDLVARLRGLVREEMGIDCLVELVPPHTLPRTSSGKLSRSGARKEFLQRLQSEEAERARPSRRCEAGAPLRPPTPA
jgi:fatty-acyl-CoA synthase